MNYKKLYELINKPYNGKWHAVTGLAYTRHNTYEEAQEAVNNFGGRVVRGDVHDLEIGIKTE